MERDKVVATIYKTSIVMQNELNSVSHQYKYFMLKVDLSPWKRSKINAKMYPEFKGGNVIVGQSALYGLVTSRWG